MISHENLNPYYRNSWHKLTVIVSRDIIKEILNKKERLPIMKKTVALILVAVMSLSLVACGIGRIISRKDVLKLYEEIKLTKDNVMDYFEIEEVDQKDAFGDKTGETEFVFKLKDGYFFDSDKENVIRVSFSYVTMQCDKDEKNPKVPTGDLDSNEDVIYHDSRESDFQFGYFDRERWLLNTSHEFYESNGYVEEGNVCVTMIYDFEVEKVAGRIIEYDLEKLEKYFPEGKNGVRTIEISVDQYNQMRHEFDEDRDEMAYEYWYESVYGMVKSWD